MFQAGHSGGRAAAPCRPEPLEQSPHKCGIFKAGKTHKSIARQARISQHGQFAGAHWDQEPIDRAFIGQKGLDALGQLAGYAATLPVADAERAGFGRLDPHPSDMKLASQAMPRRLKSWLIRSKSKFSSQKSGRERNELIRSNTPPPRFRKATRLSMSSGAQRWGDAPDREDNPGSADHQDIRRRHDAAV